MSGFIQSTLLGMGQDFVQEKATEYAGEHFQPTKDPYYIEEEDGNRTRRKLPEYCSKPERKAWKKLQNKAWLHDKSLCGCCCWTETIGWGPLLSIIPVLGPLLMYWVHNKLIEQADRDFKLSREMKLKMHGNIIVDLCISLIPIIGAVFCWLHTCSTRNAAMVYNCVVERALEQKKLEERERLAKGKQEHINETLIQKLGREKDTIKNDISYYIHGDYKRAHERSNTNSNSNTTTDTSDVRLPPPSHQEPIARHTEASAPVQMQAQAHVQTSNEEYYNHANIAPYPVDPYNNNTDKNKDISSNDNADLYQSHIRPSPN